MSETIDKAVAALADRFNGEQLGGTAKFVIDGEGTILLDDDGVRKGGAGDDAADVILTADADVFEAILGGETSPAAAFMSGKLKVDGDMGLAMKLGGVLG